MPQFTMIVLYQPRGTVRLLDATQELKLLKPLAPQPLLRFAVP